MVKSNFIKDGLALVGGNVWAQVVSIVAYVVLARLYSPQDFGLYSIFYSYIEVLIIVSTCKYESAVVIADNDREAAAVSKLAMRLNSFVSLLVLTAVLVVYMVYPSAELNFSYAVLIPPMVFFCGTSRVYSALFNRYRLFRHIALSGIIGSTSGVIFKVLFGLPQLASSFFHHVGLPLGTVLGSAASNLNYLVCKRHLPLPADITGEERRSAARKFRNFPLYTMPKDLINSLSYNLPFLWLALYFDKAEVGLFGMALTCTFRPINIFNNAFEKLLYVRVAEKVRSHLTVQAEVLRFFVVVSLVALPFFAVAFIFGDSILGFVLGGRWVESGYYLRCLLPWVFVMLTSSSLMFVSNIFSKQRTEFVFYILLLVLRVASMVAGIMTGDFRLAILLFSLSGAAVSLALVVWYFSLIHRYEHTDVI